MTRKLKVKIRELKVHRKGQKEWNTLNAELFGSKI
jgi:hypothetical protein